MIHDSGLVFGPPCIFKPGTEARFFSPNLSVNEALEYFNLIFVFRMILYYLLIIRKGTTFWTILYRVAQKSKPLPNDQKIVLHSLSMKLDLFVKLKYESNTIILFVGIKYSMRGLLYDLNNYAGPAD